MKRFFRILVIFVFAVFLILIVSLLWVVPAVVNKMAEKELSSAWGGRVRISDLEFNYFGPIYLEKIIFYDKNTRKFIQANGVKITLEKWPGLNPVLTEIEIEKLSTHLSTADGKFSLPDIPSQKQSNGSQDIIDIRNFSVNSAEIIVTDARNATARYDNLKLQVVKKDAFYDFTLNRAGSRSPESLLVKGQIDSQNLRTEISLQLQHTVQQPETAPLFAVLNKPEMSAGGRLTADLKITGPLKQPEEIKSDGTVNLEEWAVLKDDEIIARHLATQVNVKEQRFDFENITATVFDGNVGGTFQIETDKYRPTAYSGQVFAENMSFTKITSALGGPEKKAEKGTVTLDYNFSGNGSDLQNLIGEGQIFLDDADISILPSVTSTFKAIGLSKLDPLKKSDAFCTFTSAGPVITIETAQIANRFAAINVEPGGTVNIQTDDIDVYVIAAPIKQFDAVIKKIPLINMLNNIKDKFIRLRVKGKRTDPPVKLIKKEPIKDIKDATIGFFQDAIDNVGQIKKQIKRGYRSLRKPEPKPDNKPNSD